MKTENQLKAFARNLIAKGHTEAEALQILADKYPECEGTIFAMDVSVRETKPRRRVTKSEVQELVAVTDDADEDSFGQTEIDTPIVEEVEPVQEEVSVHVNGSFEQIDTDPVEVVEPVEVVTTAPVEASTQMNGTIVRIAADYAAITWDNESSEGVVDQLKSHLTSMNMTEEQIEFAMKVFKTSCYNVPKGPVMIKTAKAPNDKTKMGRARRLFLEASDRSLKALSDLFMAEIGWIRGDANYFAKQIIAEHSAGKLI